MFRIDTKDPLASVCNLYDPPELIVTRKPPEGWWEGNIEIQYNIEKVLFYKVVIIVTPSYTYRKDHKDYNDHLLALLAQRRYPWCITLELRSSQGRGLCGGASLVQSGETRLIKVILITF